MGMPKLETGPQKSVGECESGQPGDTFLFRRQCRREGRGFDVRVEQT